MSAHTETYDPKVNYINTDWTLKSWFLTLDHKRIAWLYLVSISGFFVLGGIFAMLIRLELLTPHREAVQRGLSFLAQPIHAPLAIKLLCRTVDAIWYAAVAVPQ